MVFCFLAYHAKPFFSPKEFYMSFIAKQAT